MPPYSESGELLSATCVAVNRMLSPSWSAHNLALESADTAAAEPCATFLRVNPEKAGHLIQWCNPPEAGVPGLLSICAEIRACGVDAVGLNVYCYFHPHDDHEHQVFPLAHPGDGAWHHLNRTFPLPARPVHRMRVMLVLRSGNTPVAVRNVSLRFEKEGPEASASEVSREFHEAVLVTVARHPASGDHAFREKLYHSLMGGNRKGRQAIAEIGERLRPAGFSLKGGRFLDLGCGTGGAVVGAIAAGAAWAEGWEITPEKLELARVNLGSLQDSAARFVILNRNVEDSEAAGPDYATFDLVFCQEVLEHVKDINGALRTLARCIDPVGGAAYITIPSGYALEAVLRDPHLQLFGITLLDRFEAQPLATALKNHTHYSKMMGHYHHYEDYVERFQEHGLICIPLRPADVSDGALTRCARQIEEIQEKRARLRNDWGHQVDQESFKLLESRLETYLDGAEADFARATASGATEVDRLRFVQHYGTPHLEFIVAHRDNQLFASL